MEKRISCLNSLERIREKFHVERRGSLDPWYQYHVDTHDAQVALLGGHKCTTLYDMKSAALTIRLDRDLERQLKRLARRTGRSRSDLVREALRRQLALVQFEDLRQRIMPFAEAHGYLTDEDIFRDVS